MNRVIFSYLLLFVNTALAIDFSDNRFIDTDEYSITYEDGSKSNLEISSSKSNNDKYFDVNFNEESEQGRIDTFGRFENRTLRVESFQKIAYENDGRIVRNINTNFYKEMGSSKSLFPRDIIPALLRHIDFTNAQKQELYLWFSTYVFIKMNYKVVGTELVKVPAGDFQCYKVEMWLDVKEYLGLGDRLANIAEALIPKYMYEFWYTIDKPHYFVKFKGPSTTPGSSLTIVELVKIK